MNGAAAPTTGEEDLVISEDGKAPHYADGKKHSCPADIIASEAEERPIAKMKAYAGNKHLSSTMRYYLPPTSAPAVQAAVNAIPWESLPLGL